MKNKLLLIISVVILLYFPNVNFGQAPDLGTAANFGLFTKVGALENTGPSYVTGNVGTDVGAFNGFAPATVTGEVQLGNDTTAQAALDVEALYINMAGMSCGAVLGATLGNNQVLTPNIYCIGAAATIEGDLILDAGGNRGALFVFQINGAFAPGPLSNIILVNKASMCNVYWQVNGAFATGDHSVFRGNIVVNGAIALYDNTYLAGRAFSRVGAVSLFNSHVVALVSQPITTIIAGDSTANEVTLTAMVTNASGPFSYLWSPGGETDSSITVPIAVSGSYDVIVTAMNGCSDAMGSYAVAGIPLPLELLSFDAYCDNHNVAMKWSTATETNNDYFTVQRSKDGISFEEALRVQGAGNSTVTLNYKAKDAHPFGGESYYRLKQTDFNGMFTYSNIRTVDMRNDFDGNVFPNPSIGKTFMSIRGTKAEKVHIVVFDATGKEAFSKFTVFQETGINNIAIDPPQQFVRGIYFVIITTEQNIYKHKLIIN